MHKRFCMLRSLRDTSAPGCSIQLNKYISKAFESQLFNAITFLHISYIHITSSVLLEKCVLCCVNGGLSSRQRIMMITIQDVSLDLILRMIARNDCNHMPPSKTTYFASHSIRLYSTFFVSYIPTTRSLPQNIHIAWMP